MDGWRRSRDKSALTFVARGKLLSNGYEVLETAVVDCDGSPWKRERVCTGATVALNATTHKNFIASSRFSARYCRIRRSL